MTDATTADNEVRRDRHEWYAISVDGEGIMSQCRQCGEVRAKNEPLTGECVWRPEPPAAPATTTDAQRLDTIRAFLVDAGDWCLLPHDDAVWLDAWIDRQNAVVEAARRVHSTIHGTADRVIAFEDLGDAIRALDAMSKTAPD